MNSVSVRADDFYIMDILFVFPGDFCCQCT